MSILFLVIFYIDQLRGRQADAHPDDIPLGKGLPLPLDLAFGQELPLRTNTLLFEIIQMDKKGAKSLELHHSIKIYL